MAAQLWLLLPLLAFLAAHELPAAAAADEGSTLCITHALRDDRLADTPEEQAVRDASRHLYLSSLAGGRSAAPVASGRQLVMAPIYVARVRFGTPPQPLLVAVDNSNDVAWVPCSGCVGCPPTSSRPFDPAASSSFNPVSCSAPKCALAPDSSCPTRDVAVTRSCGFGISYAGSTLQATLVQDTVAVAADVIKQFTFGCLQRVTGVTSPPAQGLLGFGRGPMSFLSQTSDVYASTFSYCLPSYKSLNFSGTLRLGTKGQPKRIKTTPLLSNPHRPSLYYVNMTGIRVGSRPAPIPPASLAFDPSTGAGTVIDSGTMFTILSAPAYAAVRDEFRRRVGAPLKSLGGFDTCYDGAVKVPSVTLVFDGMQVTLPEENVMIHSTSGTLSCLAMAAAPSDGVNSGLNVVGSMQQQNHRVLFDVPRRRVGFARESCTAAA